ncbi:hypothetical protein ZIOFF_004798 [Zingiber officinale]|uniref:FAD/NAD(P)-binding domain-containing protein n=1 Tax=Zingiber officinale TaxID=94328 RepID=A0A8J5M3Y4_ZINOF|nr:hypothetical protein ZIOFF_004798 [Zingiber officinale]
MEGNLLSPHIRSASDIGGYPQWVISSSGSGRSSSSSSTSAAVCWKRVVIVGGGIAGSVVAKSLQFVADVVLIDQKEYFEISWATMRSMVDPAFADKAVVNHVDYLVNAKVVVASAVDITDTEVITSDGRQFPYDYLVIATGHSVSSPQSRRERMDKFREANAKMKNSSSILIIGGGPSGVELASDIAASYPEKKVTLVHSGPRLLGFIGSKAGSKALEWLRSKNVDVLLEQTIDLDTFQANKGVYITSAGEAIAADVHYLCVRRPLGSAWLKESVVKDCLDKYGQLMVDEHLRVKGFNNIFAIGDIIDVPVSTGAKTGGVGAEARDDRVEELESADKGGERGEGSEAGEVQAIHVDRDGVVGEEGLGGAAAVHDHDRAPPWVDQEQRAILEEDEEAVGARSRLYLLVMLGMQLQILSMPTLFGFAFIKNYEFHT